MSDVTELVDSLEVKIAKMLNKLELLKQTNEQLQEELTIMNDKKNSLEKIILDWEEKYHSLKLAKSITGSNENNKDAKLKINALIREIDHCIVQLSE